MENHEKFRRFIRPAHLSLAHLRQNSDHSQKKDK